MNLYVIHLPERIDRWEKIKSAYPEYHLIPVEAIRHENGRIGCFLSHQKCVRMAKEANMKYICVLEDDCEPIENRGLLLYKDFLENGQWSIFIGGGTGTWDGHVIQKLDKTLYKVTKIKTTHMICYNQSIYDFFLFFDPHKTDLPVDRIWHGHMHAIIPIPFIATQSNGYSDIEKKEMTIGEKINICNSFLIKHVKTIFSS